MAKKVADDKLGENLFRRQAMVVAVALIAVNIVILYGYKRKLSRQLEEESTE